MSAPRPPDPAPVDAATPAPSARRAWIRVLAPLLGGLAAAALAAAGLRALAGAPPAAPGPIAAAVGLWLLAGVLGGRRLRLLLPPALAAQAPAAWRLGIATLGVHALNLALPGPAGDLALLAALRQRGVGAAPLGAALLAGRALGLGAIGALALILLPMAPLDGPAAAALWAGVGPPSAGALVLGFAVLRPALLSRALLAPLRALARRGGPAGRLGARLTAPVGRVAEALEAAGPVGLPRQLAAFGISALMQLLLWAALAALVSGAAAQPPALAALGLAHAIGELVTVALAIAPAGLGALEAGLGGALHLLCGLSPAEAAAVVVQLRAVQLLSLAIGAPLAGAALPGLLRPGR